MKQYRALISIPIEANSDDDAIAAATKQADSLPQPTGGAGQVELVGELRGDLLAIARVAHADPLFFRQLPPDWKA